MRRERVHWPVGELTRCGIRVVRRQRVGRHGTMIAKRLIHAGQAVDIPRFLQLEERCRHCAQALRKDTGLLANRHRERNSGRRPERTG